MDKKKLIPLFTIMFLFLSACVLKLFIKDGKFSTQFIYGILEGKKSSLFIFLNMRNTPPTPLTPVTICFGVVESSISRGELKSAK